jgi:hypothetical protein
MGRKGDLNLATGSASEPRERPRQPQRSAFVELAKGQTMKELHMRPQVSGDSQECEAQQVHYDVA